MDPSHSSGDPSSVLLWMLEPPAEVDQEWNLWYDTEHVPALMEVPGFLNGARYRCETPLRGEGPPRYLAYYELTARDVLDSEPYHRNRASLGEGMRQQWTQQMLAAVTRAAGGIYDIQSGRAFTAAETDPGADGLLLVGADSGAGRAWLKGEFLPAVTASPDVVGFRELSLAAGSPRIAAMRDRDESPKLLIVIATDDAQRARALWTSAGGAAGPADFAAAYTRILSARPAL